MNDDKTVSVNVRSETPRDLEAEDYLYRVKQLLDVLREDSPDVSCNSINRICDGCKCILPFRQRGLDFRCKNCRVRFDLCGPCQQDHSLTHCPDGWGCECDLSKKIDSAESIDIKKTNEQLEI